MRRDVSLDQIALLKLVILFFANINFLATRFDPEDISVGAAAAAGNDSARWQSKITG